MDMFEALSALTAAPGVTGNERGAADVVSRYFKAYADDVRRDRLGNVFATVGSGKPVVLIMAHMDEIGMTVTNIEENGMLRLQSVAGVDPRVLPGSEVLVYGKEPLRGVVGAIPPHLLSEKDRESAYKMEDLACDLGLAPEKVRELVNIGDSVTFAPLPPLKLKNNRAAGKTFDDRALVVTMLEALDMLKSRKLGCTAVFCATVQEERGSFGAKTGAFGVDPDIGIAMDVTHAPTPGVDAMDALEMDKISIARGSNIHPGVYKRLTDAAKECGAAWEAEVYMGHTGTDAWETQVERGGIPTGLLSVPVRYMHTNVETMSLDTLRNCSKLLVEFLMGFGESWEETLCFKD
ncbi:MAG: M20/M25/M40 family metallo-hydrolase [Clostridiaceae bacterium]|nr:M20/M25/M40 family metallo-hydrolase [Eubacteriales bacterium]